MPCHPKALARYARMIRADRSRADEWLDRWIEATTLATEWDADQWGFDPDRWMLKERLEMDRRADGTPQGRKVLRNEGI